MTPNIAPVSAWCPIDETGALQVQHLQYYRHEIMVPAGRNWKIVRVVIDPMETWEDRDAAAKAVDALPDCVACALLGVDEDAPMEDVL